MHEAGNDCKYSSYGENIVEVGYYVVSVMKDNVQRRVGEDDPG